MVHHLEKPTIDKHTWKMAKRFKELEMVNYFADVSLQVVIDRGNKIKVIASPKIKEVRKHEEEGEGI